MNNHSINDLSSKAIKDSKENNLKTSYRSLSRSINNDLSILRNETQNIYTKCQLNNKELIDNSVKYEIKTPNYLKVLKGTMKRSLSLEMIRKEESIGIK